jgi:hypothetical protein
MEPRRLEEVLYLRYNGALWDERTVKQALDAFTSERNAARAAAARTREVASASTAVAARSEDYDSEEL